jgi:hypothetical protein
MRAEELMTCFKQWSRAQRKGHIALRFRHVRPEDIRLSSKKKTTPQKARNMSAGGSDDDGLSSAEDIPHVKKRNMTTRSDDAQSDNQQTSQETDLPRKKHKMSSTAEQEQSEPEGTSSEHDKAPLEEHDMPHSDEQHGPIKGSNGQGGDSESERAVEEDLHASMSAKTVTEKDAEEDLHPPSELDRAPSGMPEHVQG